MVASVTFMPGARQIPDPDAELRRLAGLRTGAQPAEVAAEVREVTCEPVSIEKLTSDAVHISTAGYVLLKMDTGSPDRADAALTFEIHADGCVIPPDGWEAIIVGGGPPGGLIVGARHTGQVAANAHLRRRRRQ